MNLTRVIIRRNIKSCASGGITDGLTNGGTCRPAIIMFSQKQSRRRFVGNSTESSIRKRRHEVSLFRCFMSVRLTSSLLQFRQSNTLNNDAKIFFVSLLTVPSQEEAKVTQIANFENYLNTRKAIEKLRDGIRVSPNFLD